MKVYVAGSTREIDRVRRVQQICRNLGCEITFDWTGEEGEIRSSWHEAPDTARALADREIEACRRADVIILCWSERVLGALLEAGAGMGARANVIVLGTDRESVFWYGSKVQKIESENELTEALAKCSIRP